MKKRTNRFYTTEFKQEAVTGSVKMTPYWQLNPDP